MLEKVEKRARHAIYVRRKTSPVPAERDTGMEVNTLPSCHCAEMCSYGR